jgi:hypothetical protein
VKATVGPANRDDADFLAWVILTAARSHLPRGTWDIAIEGTEEDRLDLFRWMVLSEVPSIFQLSGFPISTVAPRPVTAMAGFDPKDPGMTTPGELWPMRSLGSVGVWMHLKSLSNACIPTRSVRRSFARERGLCMGRFL